MECVWHRFNEAFAGSGHMWNDGCNNLNVQVGHRLFGAFQGFLELFRFEDTD
ncbi:MAG: hypothetical protein PHV83_03985 [Bacteroidales bacterium]|nr:hypothetical protein [Bacteroidales bacterium]